MSYPNNPSHRAVTKFEKVGPWTFEEALRVAIICGTNVKDECVIGDCLDNIIHKFPPPELAKLLAPEQNMSDEQYELWCEGTNWELEGIPSHMTHEQLEVLATYKHFHHLAEGIRWDKVSVATKLALLKESVQPMQ